MALSPELLTQLHQLDRAEKLRAIQFLANELAAEETAIIDPSVHYEVWSPFDAAGAADDLLKMLEDHKQSNNE
ncbi:MAG: hypothetical protein IT324_09885 [Anaerolineae bacterium]|nr:hypothetical protein [Anaerolineae bacterium]